MSEFVMHRSREPRLDHAACREKLYTLLAIFMASPRIAEQCWDDIDCMLLMSLDEFQEQLATRLLIDTAVTIRMQQDHIRQYPQFQEFSDDVVGDLESDGSVENLTLREACNKIIHAKALHFDYEKADKHAERYLNPLIHLHGSKSKRPWKATLHIVKWCEAGVGMMNI